MPFLKIPSRYDEGLKKIILLDDLIFDQLIRVLENANPCLNVKILARSVANSINLETTEDLEKILDTIMSLSFLKNNNDIQTDELVNDLIDAIKESKNLEEIYSQKYSQDNQGFKRKLSVLLELDRVFGISAKALSVLTEQDNLFLRSRVLTDMRPVFPIDSDSEIAGVVIVHNLKIEYRHENQKKEFFVALDVNDIKQLKEQLERAETKALTIQNKLNESNIYYLNAER